MTRVSKKTQHGIGKVKQRVGPFRSLQSFTGSRRRNSRCPIHFINGCPDLVFGPDGRAKDRDAGRGRGRNGVAGVAVMMVVVVVMMVVMMVVVVVHVVLVAPV